MDDELHYVPGRLAAWARGALCYPDQESAGPWLCDLEAYLWGIEPPESLEAARLLCRGAGREPDSYWGQWIVETVMVILDSPEYQLELGRGLSHMCDEVAAVVMEDLRFSMPKGDLATARSVSALIEQRTQRTSDPEMSSYMRLLAESFRDMHLPVE